MKKSENKKKQSNKIAIAELAIAIIILMGRYNNRRTQAAAEALNRTPARARFSKGPPNKGRKRNNNNNNNANANSKQSQSGGRQPNAKATARVIDKIQTRVQQQQQRPQKAAAATTEQVLQFVDKTKFDELQLSEDIVANITTLLENLGVKETSSLNRLQSKNENVDENNDDELSMKEGDDDDEEEHVSDPFTDGTFDIPDDSEEENDMPAKNYTHQMSGGGGYAEYDDDVVEEDFTYNDYHGGDDTGGGGVDNVENDDEQQSSDDDTANVVDLEDVREDPAFFHLTQRLSFFESHAARACRAIKDWDIPSSSNPNDNKSSSKVMKSNNEAIALAMDWLCLHLTEVELTRGFQPNKNPSKQQQSSTLLISKSGIPLVGSGSIKAIPHPSISVAKSITSDKEWTRSVRIQERIVGFVRLGFHHHEASQACEARDDYENGDTQKPVDDPILLRLLSTLEQGVVGGEDISCSTAESLNPTDLEYAAEEREQELEALKAIYDDELEIIQAPSLEGSGNEIPSMDRYVLTIKPAEDLRPPARSQDCRLHVFLRPGYPVVETPLFLFSNPSLPPSLLRRINDGIARQAQESKGAPVCFEIVTWLSDSLPDMQQDFIKEQRHKEFEAEQVRLRKEVDGRHKSLERVIDAQYETDGKLGRRQRAKLKAAEKFYDRPEQIQKQNEERLRLQNERIKRAQDESMSIRGSMADKAVLKREEERIQEEARLAARAAMNDAFNRGESVDEARAAADKARIASLRMNGVDVEGDEDKEADEEVDETKALNTEHQPSEPGPTAQTAEFMERLKETAFESKANNIQSTAQTSAFMDRLRQMYDKAATNKDANAAGVDEDSNNANSASDPTEELERYHLDDPGHSINAEDNLDRIRAPRPVAVPTGELGEVMNDIITQQKDQPWLVSSEARAPTISFYSEREKKLSPEDARRQKAISKQLRHDVERKQKLALEWAENNPNVVPQRDKRNTGFTPQKFYSLMSVRRR